MVTLSDLDTILLTVNTTQNGIISMTIGKNKRLVLPWTSTHFCLLLIFRISEVRNFSPDDAEDAYILFYVESSCSSRL